MSFHERNKLWHFLYSKFMLFVIFVVIVVLSQGVYGIYKKSRESSIDRNFSEREFKELQDREKMLSQKVDFMKTDRGVEEEIREKYDVAKDGEKVIVLVDEPVVAASSTDDANIFKAMWNKIKGAF